MAHAYLSTTALANHWRLTEATVAARIRAGDVPAIRMGRVWRVAWRDVWSVERGPLPAAALAERYKAPLWTKRDVANAAEVSLRTVDRWIAMGLPTRNVFGSVRFNRHDVADWLRLRFGMDLHIPTQKTPASHGRPRTQCRFPYGDACATGMDSALPAREQSANKTPTGPAAPHGRGRRARDGENA